MAGNPTTIRTQNTHRWSIAIWGAAAALLSIPLVAMQFTREVNWTLGDFLVMGALLAIVCGLVEFGMRLSDSRAYRGGFALAIVTGFVTVWANLAVGMLGSEHNPDNLWFGAVLLVAALGALLARFKPAGMARAMQAAALAQAAMAVYAFVGGYREVVIHVGAFALPWLAAALLFRASANQPTRAPDHD
jgi:hypothetical protein